MISWTIRVDWHRQDEPTEADFEHILTRLAGLHPALNIERIDRPADPVQMSATVTFEAATVRQASATALAAVESASNVKAHGLEILTTEEFERQLNIPRIPDLVGLADIAEILGVSRQRAAELSAAANFPPAVAHTKAAGPLRVRRQVEVWASTWERKPGRPKKVTDPGITVAEASEGAERLGKLLREGGQDLPRE